jgi:predicted metal-dependent hydrolase
MQSSSPDLTIAARRMDFAEATARIPMHFAPDGDLLTSHFWAVLSALFPEGEDSFVRAVRHYRDQLTDPVLKRQVAGFIGQEAQHSRAHQALNDRLHELGYPVYGIDRFHKRMNWLIYKFPSPEMDLAFTTVYEHLTALMAELALSDERFRESFGEIHDLLLWHAIEESEHKAVAFDVYRAVGIDPKRRIRAMRFTRWTLPLLAVGVVLQAVLTDRAARRPRALWASVKCIRANPLFSKSTMDAIRDFERPDFHPNQRDTTALLAEWRVRLFGSEGTLTHRLLQRPA